MWPVLTRRTIAIEKLEPRLCLSGVAFAEQLVSEAGWAASLNTADVDGDGDMDLIATSWDTVNGRTEWFENIDGQGSFGQPKLVPSASGLTAVFAADVDGDDDVDVVFASAFDNTLSWYENTDGKGNFGQQQIISTAAGALDSVYGADVDGDGDMDVVSATSRPIGIDSKVVWYENTDGKGRFGPENFIATSGSNWTDRSLSAADLDGDGDLDILHIYHPVFDPQTMTRKTPSNLVWYENTDGNGSFGSGSTIFAEADYQLPAFSVDLDGDGDLDVLAASRFDDSKIVWYENVNGMGDFGQKHVVAASRWDLESAFPLDIDGDHDVDVLSVFGVSTAQGWVSRMIWYENIDGLGTFGAEQLIANYPFSVMSALAADLDGDHDVDVLLSSDDGIRWLENLTPRLAAGDANRDFQFDQHDIVQVLQAAKYLTGEPANFDEGDWNGDGAFDQLDIVAALQTGNYLQGATALQVLDAAFTSAEP